MNNLISINSLIYLSDTGIKDLSRPSILLGECHLTPKPTASCKNTWVKGTGYHDNGTPRQPVFLHLLRINIYRPSLQGSTNEKQGFEKCFWPLEMSERGLLFIETTSACTQYACPVLQ
ncbi:hypothetical protein NPIL_657431 [Nephila pilipes]|uniref:Uncharacterized protein n=1 Tax=Nephila pilipes TaxID=299642 RepID=A0A8X6QAN6_NEPPI|nr:hypothetical protein NPIL_657431 [Nephila pilipes]